MRAKWELSVLLVVFGLCLFPQSGHARADHTYGKHKERAKEPDYAAVRSEVTARISEEKAGTLDPEGPDRLSPLEVRYRDTCVDLKKAPDWVTEVKCDQLLRMIQVERDQNRFLEADPNTLAAQRNRLTREKEELLKENQRLKNEAAQCRAPAISNANVKKANRRGEGVQMPVANPQGSADSIR
jgi:hypothetical protein